MAKDTGRGGCLARHSTIKKMGPPAHLSMGTEQCAAVFLSVVSLVFSNLELLSRWFRAGLRMSVDGVVSVGDGVRPANKGTTESDRECWLPDIQCNWHQKSVSMEGSQVHNRKHSLQLTNPTGNLVPTSTAMLSISAYCSYGCFI